MELISGLPNDVARECLLRIPYKTFSSALAVCKSWRNELDSEQFHRLRKSSGLSKTVVVLAQAEPIPVNEIEDTAAKYFPAPTCWLNVYEPRSGTWDRLPAIPNYPSGVPLFCQCVSVGRSLVVIGGYNPLTWEVSTAVYVYDFVLAAWRHGSDIPGPARSLFACASDSYRKVFIAGGHDQEKNALSSAYMYDVPDDKWVQIADMEKQRDECKGVFTNGKFLAIGGYSTDKQGQFEKSSKAFNTITCKWEQINEDFMETATCPKTCVATEEGTIYRYTAGNIEVLYNNTTWKKNAKVPVDVRVGTHLVAWQDKLFVTGSEKYGGPCNSYVLEFETLKTKDLCKWKRVNTPSAFTGNVQVGCSLDI